MMRSYRTKRYVRAFRFLGVDDSSLPWLKVCGVKLPENEREGEFYNQQTENYERAQFGDWIVITEDLFRMVVPNEVFVNLFIEEGDEYERNVDNYDADLID